MFKNVKNLNVNVKNLPIDSHALGKKTYYTSLCFVCTFFVDRLSFMLLEILF